MSSKSNDFILKSPFSPSGAQPEVIEKITKGILEGKRLQTLLGVTGSGKTYTMANVIANLQRPAILLAPNKTLAAQLYSEMKDFFPNNHISYFVSYYDYYQPEAYVPGTDTFIEKDATINEQIEQMRLAATNSMLQYKDTIIVSSVSAIYGLGDPESYQNMSCHLKVGKTKDQRDLIRELALMQYRRHNLSFERGLYRVRGDVIDIFPSESEMHAIRVELYDDEIDNLSLFDPLTGEIYKEIDEVTIYPKTHYVSPKDKLPSIIAAIKNDLKDRLAEFKQNGKLLEAQRLEQRTLHDIEMLEQLGFCQGIENYSRYLSQQSPGQAPPTLMDYLPQDTLVIIDESHVTVPQIRGMYRGDRARKMNLVEYGFRLPSALDNRPLKFEEFDALGFQTLFVSATPAQYEMENSEAIVEMVIRPTGLLDPKITVKPAVGQVESVLGEIRTIVKKSQRVLITTLTKKMAEDLTGYLDEQGIRVRYLHSSIDTVERVEIIKGLRRGDFDVLVGINLLREGLDLPEVSLVAILDADKEGFLRSESALIQTIGRAARNIDGQVIMYADRMTRSMEAAISETERRRELQTKFNQENGIEPKSIVKKVTEILEADQKKAKESSPFEKMSPKEINSLIKQKEKQMKKASDDLDFEKAAVLRDELKALKEALYYE